MKAIVYDRYGGPEVLELRDIAKPIPKQDEVLIKVRAVGLNSADRRLMRADPFLIRFDVGLFAPKKDSILGSDVAGMIETVGTGVTDFKVGDEVFVDLSDCGQGGLAEYVTASANLLAKKPEQLSFEETAALPMAAGTALQGLRDSGKIRRGQKVLINGASGGVGTFAVQIAKSFGAEVTAVCSTGKVDLVRSLGADHVIDYKKEDVTQSGEQYDLILVVNGDRRFAEFRPVLSPDGTVVYIGGSMMALFQVMLFGKWLTRGTNQTAGVCTAKGKKEDLEFISKLIEKEELFPVIDKRFPLSGASEAMAYLDTGRAKGKVVVTI